MMLAPQFSLRRLLAWVTASAFVCLIGAAAARGQLWAAGVLIALGGAVAVMLVHGATFGVVKLLGAARESGRRSKGQAAPKEARQA